LNTTFLHSTPGILGLSESLFYWDKAIITYKARVLGFGDKQCPKHVKLHPWVLIIKLSLPTKFYDFWSYLVISKIPKV
jgi:hypothetical protein